MATTNWEQLHSIFYGNMNDAMLACLAEQLGVSKKSLRDLQVGWAPTVPTKKGIRYGYWTIPMRDATGKVVGLAVRDREGGKFSYTGSGRGCFYVVNPDHKNGERGYSAGAHNWVRTMDVQELCPLCGKPDGCLLSAENPRDPKAVICRVNPSPKRMKFGWLHIRKDAGNMHVAVLGGTEDVIVVEGMSDAAAALDLGYSAVGRPNDLGGQDIVKELVRGRAFLVVGENDQKSDGKWPGRDGMLATYNHIRTATHSGKMLMPPKAVKDLRSWVTVNGLTREAFEAYAEKHATEKIEGMLLGNNHPITVAEAFLKDEHYAARRFLVRRWAEQWYVYNPGQGRYAPLPDAELSAEFYQWSKDKQYSEPGPQGDKVEPLIVTAAAWSNFQQAASSIVILKGVTEVPLWINGAEGPSARDLIVFNNGILDVAKYLESHEEHLLDTTPDFFNTTALPLPFNSAATCPAWLSFLTSSLGDEPAKIDLLQEWIGYCLTPDTTMHKMMYFRGESGAGKGTVLRVMQSLVGNHQYAASSLSQLAETFGLQPLVGKLICTIGDARLSKNSDAMRGLEVLLGLTGGDAQQVNRKFKDQLEGSYLTARVTIASNDFLDLPDQNGAMARRLNVLQFARSFRGKEDRDLDWKLAEEIDGIAVWALEGLRRLRKQGRFTEPPSSAEALDDWNMATNPMLAFLDECIVKAERTITTADMLYDCWQAWTKDTHRKTGSRRMFLRLLENNAEGIVEAGSGYKGLDISPDAVRRYLR